MRSPAGVTSASKRRPLWLELPPEVRSSIEQLVGAKVVWADNRAEGFSPGFASQLRLIDRRRVFVKAVDAVVWPTEAGWYRAEAASCAALPPETPAPRLLRWAERHSWVFLVYEEIIGAHPQGPWTSGQLELVIESLAKLVSVGEPAPNSLPDDHPRLGGWAELAANAPALGGLRERLPWAESELERLIDLETQGLAAAKGNTLTHFDLYRHNILMAGPYRRAVFIDWAHPRQASSLVDLVMLLAGATADGADPDPILNHCSEVPRLRKLFKPDPAVVTAILAADVGFLLLGGLTPIQAGLEPIAEAKLRLGLGAAGWLRTRLAVR
jgi:hypothetical protein